MNNQAGDIQASRIRIASTDEIAAALDSAGLRLDRAVIVLVGGAGIMGEKEFETVAQVLRDEVVPVAERRDAVVIDGGTDSGVMQLIGRARSTLGGRFPARRRRGRRYGPPPGGRDAVARRGQTGAEPHAVPPSTRHAMGGRGAVDDGRRRGRRGPPVVGHRADERRADRLH